MRHFALLFALVLLGFALPAAAQTNTDPAAYLPDSIPLYFEVRTDEAGLDGFRSLLQTLARFSNSSPPETDLLHWVVFEALPDGALPGIETVEDLVSWTGGRIGVGAYSNLVTDPTKPTTSDFAIVFPVADISGAQAFVELVTADATAPETLAFGDVYDLQNGTSLFVDETVIWLGTPFAIEQGINDLAGGTLADADWYNNVKSQLPADPLMSGYINGEWMRSQVAQQEAMSPPDAPSAAVLFETVLRLHPAESAMEDAFLQFPPFIGAGFTVEYVDGRLDITAAATVDATYPAPTLTTETAGAGLLDVIPADAVLVYDTYDGAIPIGAVGGLALLGPAIGSVFDSIVFQLENPGVPTPTPTPTPTPLPPPTADELIAQAQPYIQEAEALLGISLAELYGLINGELAIAVFPPESSPTITEFGTMVTPGFALWLQTADPERFLEVIERSRDSLSLLTGSPISGTAAILFESDTLNGVEVMYFGTVGTAPRGVYGVLNGDILFLTTENSLETVLNAASDDTSITQTRAWHNDVYESFGVGQEVLIYVDLSKYMSLTWGPYLDTPASRPGQFIATADIADNGVFLLHAAWLLEQ